MLDDDVVGCVEVVAIVEGVTVEEVLVVVVGVTVLVVDVVDVVLVDDVVVLVVVVVPVEYVKVALPEISGGYAPQVAFTMYVPDVQPALPPATTV